MSHDIVDAIIGIATVIVVTAAVTLVALATGFGVYR